MKKSIRDSKEIEFLEVDGLGKITKGVKVLHPVFGAGVIVGLREFPPYSQTRHAISVEFEAVGLKALDPEYAKLTINEA
jgi:hypothetical protein